jgi:bacillithiol biosynthesis cysteine-adding enzyme BshC
MDLTATRIPYSDAGVFSHIMLDYVGNATALTPFYKNAATIEGVKKSIEQRKLFPTDRTLLVEQLRLQYAGINAAKAVTDNIECLVSQNVFTITTAHQNNIFTGPLYFIYKIIHAIRLAKELSDTLKECKFVPVYYIGSEDADLAELNHIFIGERKLEWKTKQTGAVGRMLIDKELVKLIDDADGEISVMPHGAEIITALRKHYTVGKTVQDATFHFVNSLFESFGLIVLLPDNAALKAQMIPVFEDELKSQHATAIVEQTATALTAAGYKVQAHPRDINLFYLVDNIRERIEHVNGKYRVVNSTISFSTEELMAELKQHPERFSPNVILRGLYQETILPNVVFIGGGGETAYWLQLNSLFDFYKVPYPVLVVRNSFLIVEKKWGERVNKLGLEVKDLFQGETKLLDRIVKDDAGKSIKLNGTITAATDMYAAIRAQAEAVDITLGQHVDALKTATIQRLEILEKKMLRAEKRKYKDQLRQIQQLRSALFPVNGLQERSQNLMYFYGKWGKEFITMLYDASPSLQQEFTILTS